MGVEIEYPLGYASSGDSLFRDTGLGLTMLQVFQLKRAYPQSMNFRGLP